jgi:hypothetical protein
VDDRLQSEDEVSAGKIACGGQLPEEKPAIIETDSSHNLASRKDAGTP